MRKPNFFLRRLLGKLISDIPKLLDLASLQLVEQAAALLEDLAHPPQLCRLPLRDPEPDLARPALQAPLLLIHELLADSQLLAQSIAIRREVAVPRLLPRPEPSVHPPLELHHGSLHLFLAGRAPAPERPQLLGVVLLDLPLLHRPRHVLRPERILVLRDLLVGLGPVRPALQLVRIPHPAAHGIALDPQPALARVLVLLHGGALRLVQLRDDLPQLLEAGRGLPALGLERLVPSLPALLGEPPLPFAERPGVQLLLALELADEAQRLLHLRLLPRLPLETLASPRLGLLLEHEEVRHRARTRLPARAADVAELGAASARHVLAAVGMLDEGLAVVAALPPCFLGELVGPDHVRVLGAVVAFVLRVAADDAGVMPVGAPRHALREDDVFRPDEQPALGLAAVYSVGHRLVPFHRPLAIFGPLPLVDVGVDGALGDGVQAALRRPVQLVLAGGSNETAEAGYTVVVTRASNGPSGFEIL